MILPAYSIGQRTFAKDQAISEAWAKIQELRRIGGCALAEACDKYRHLLEH